MHRRIIAVLVMSIPDVVVSQLSQNYVVSHILIEFAPDTLWGRLSMIGVLRDSLGIMKY